MEAGRNIICSRSQKKLIELFLFHLGGTVPGVGGWAGSRRGCAGSVFVTALIGLQWLLLLRKSHPKFQNSGCLFVFL